MEYDVIVLGGGPGGYPAAIRLAEAGLKVALVEGDKVGGECTNYGCVPTKALEKYASILAAVKELGFQATWTPSDALKRALDYSRKVAVDVSNGLSSLLSSHGVDVYHGYGKVTGTGSIMVDGVKLEWRRALILSTGSDPYNPFNHPVDHVLVHDNRSILSWDPRDAREVAVIGGGYVGVEYSYILSTLGLKVDLIEALDQLLPAMDRDLGLVARRMLARLGVKVRLESPVRGLEEKSGRVLVHSEKGVVEADAVLVAIGRRPRNTEALRLGVEVDGKGYVRVDECGRTSKPGVYAAGDIAGPPLLAHKAIHASLNAAECILVGKASPIVTVPSVVYGPIDLVSVGATLADASQSGVKAVEVRVPTGALARSRIHGVAEGFVKVVYEKTTGRIIGVHMAFPEASESAGSAAALVKLRVPITEASEIVYPHPTMSEAIQEAVNAAAGRPVHVMESRVREN